MCRKLSIFALIFAWICANGAVWNVVQVIAWGKMFADYSKVMPVALALELTFDGSAPCDICDVSQQAQDQARDEQSPSALGGTDKLVFAFQSAGAALIEAPRVTWPGLAHEAGLTRAESVPVPPPRA